MIPLIEKNRRAIEELCRKYYATRLEIFGSAASDNFIPERSDIDFLVKFQPDSDLGPWMAHYFDFRDELGELLGFKVDLVMESSLTNPYFIKEVNRTRKLLYEAKIS
ncbi:MAG: nucleotidyltransferase domain-containing protein [Deltaproteobacteria bacterium]|jgi:predicted nucleotidyltransferase|nr:nucleotidyltransferase domain-containing protein [Deltaproteobacteria bacterium]